MSDEKEYTEMFAGLRNSEQEKNIPEMCRRCRAGDHPRHICEICPPVGVTLEDIYGALRSWR